MIELVKNRNFYNKINILNYKFHIEEVDNKVALNN